MLNGDMYEFLVFSSDDSWH